MVKVQLMNAFTIGETPSFFAMLMIRFSSTPAIKKLTVIQELKDLHYDVTDEGEIEDYLGVRIEQLPNGHIHMTQPQLINSILKDLKLKQTKSSTGRCYQAKTQPIPAPSTVVLPRDIDSELHKESWSYHSVIGKLNFLEKSPCPDLVYSVHNAARFSADPKDIHSKAVKKIGFYLLGTKDKGLIMKPDPSKSIKVFADADFCGLFDSETAHFDPVTAKSCTGYIIKFMGCPIIWASKLQTETALSTCEAEYISCSESLHAVIPIMNLLDEVHLLNIVRLAPDTKIYCKLFCDNNGACELLKLRKVRPCTKHFNNKLHQFCEHITSGKISVHYVPSADQQENIAMKPLSLPLLPNFANSFLDGNLHNIRQGSVGFMVFSRMRTPLLYVTYI